MTVLDNVLNEEHDRIYKTEQSGFIQTVDKTQKRIVRTDQGAYHRTKKD
ncbi:MAG: hypothetical protein VB031_00180 [Eubacteriaceae bacterium]|nr:hypothetical protein [Eubacteriaceae bacterium]